MSNKDFQPGDRVRELSTGDEGIVLGEDGQVRRIWENNIYVKWLNGESRDCELHINKNEIELVRDGISSVDEAIAFLTNAGYKVTLSR